MCKKESCESSGLPDVKCEEYRLRELFWEVHCNDVDLLLIEEC
jgi:hypothetical protein